MAEASFASLGPALLARKGAAKPAMRPQFAIMPEELAAFSANDSANMEDLGWNDMGAERVQDAADDLPAAPAFADSARLREVVSSQPSRIIRADEPQRTRKNNRSAQAEKPQRKAAFTLRLDPQRHLKMRLAATIEGKSAQAFITQVLDRALQEFEDVAGFVAQLERETAPGSHGVPQNPKINGAPSRRAASKTAS